MAGRRPQCVYDIQANFLTWRSEIKKGNKTFKLTSEEEKRVEDEENNIERELEEQIGLTSVKATIKKTIIKTSEARSGNKRKTKTQSLINNIQKLNDQAFLANNDDDGAGTNYSDDDNSDNFSSYSFKDNNNNQHNGFNIPQLFSMFNHPQFSISERLLNTTTTTVPYQIDAILQFISDIQLPFKRSIEMILLDNEITTTPFPRFVLDIDTSQSDISALQQQSQKYVQAQQWTFIPSKTSKYFTVITDQIKQRTRLLLALAQYIKNLHCYSSSITIQISQHIHACIHRFVPLMIEIESEEFYADDDDDEHIPDFSTFPLFSPDVNDFKQCAVLTSDTIPDATWLLDASFVYNGLDESNHQLLLYKFRYATDAETQLLDYIIHFLYKTNPHPCYGRQLHTLCLEACKNKNTSMFFVDFLGKILLAAMLGIYSSSKIQAPLDVCVQLYALYKDGISREFLCESLSEKTAFVLLYFAREYTYHLVDQSPSFSKFVSTQPNWDKFRPNKSTICDRLRQSIITFVRETVVTAVRRGDVADNFNLLARTMEHADVIGRLQCKDIQNVFSKDGNLNYNIRAVHNVFDNHNLVTYHSRWRDCDELQKITKANYKKWCGKEYLLPDPTPQVPQEIETMIRDFVTAYYYDDEYMTRHMTLHWLVLLGMSVDGCCKMRQAVFSKSTVLEKTVKGLERRDFLLAFTLFKCVKERFLLVPIRGNVSYFIQRMVNMIEFFNIQPHETFPTVAAMTLVCPSCKDIKDQVFHQQHVVGQTGLGAGKVKMNDDGEFFCARHVSRNDWENIFPHHNRKKRYVMKKKYKGRNKVGSADDDDMGDDDANDDGNDDGDDDKEKSENNATTERKIAKLVQIQHEIKKCEKTRTIEINGLYGPCSFNGTVFIACCNCGKIVDKYQIHYLDKSMVCSSCFVANIDEKRYKSEKCEYCDCIISNRKKVLKFNLFDDCHTVNEIEKQQFRDMFFCTNHNPLSWIITNNIISKKTVMTGIMNHWGKSKDNSRFNIIPVGDTSAGEYNFALKSK